MCICDSFFLIYVEMKKNILIILTALCSFIANSEENPKFDIYGQIRTDLFYNSRENVESVDGLFYSYPKNVLPDANDSDLNDNDNSNMYLLYSRLGFNVSNIKLASANATAKVEFDFRGSGSTLSIARLRHAYLNLDWGAQSVLVGQTWHPFYGEVAPQILNLNMGSPYQPFSRAPQVRFRYKKNKWQFTATALWQSQYLSNGPDGKTNKYIKNSCVPELHIGLDYKKGALIAGVGVDFTSLTPRIQATVGNNIYKVDERISTFSYEIHAKYTTPIWYFAAKSVLGSNLTQTSMLGGYGVKSIDPITGEQKYTPNRNSSSWINVVYGNKWKAGVFMGYMKNLGTNDAVSKMYGTGVDVDQLFTGSAEITYNIPHWKIGIEYNYTSAWYGDLNNKNGKIINTNSVHNNRIVATAIFTF